MGRTRPDLPMNGEDPGLYLIYVALIVCDVGPRDGLQNEPRALEPAVRAELCDRLAAAGLRRIEAASFVNPQLVPPLAVPPDEICVADTIGVGVPPQVHELVRGARELGATVGAHFHNTRNTGYANAVAALEEGVVSLDASVGGAGGCPFAPKATGNIATEDLDYLLRGLGVETGIDLDALIGTSQWLDANLSKKLLGTIPGPGA